jgi:predicted DNA binding protein
VTREKVREMAAVVAQAGGLIPAQAPGLEEIFIIIVRDALEEAAREAASDASLTAMQRSRIAEAVRALKPELSS